MEASGDQCQRRTISVMKLKDLGSLSWRGWFYFRMGYSTYLTFVLGYVSTLVTVYYLAIRNMPFLLDIFPKFLEFAILGTLIGGPLAVLIGWVHLKRSSLFSSEADVGVEANPYSYKLPPGYTKEVVIPSAFLQLRILQRLAETDRLLTPSEKAEIAELERKFVTLLHGGYVGSPRRKLSSLRQPSSEIQKAA